MKTRLLNSLAFIVILTAMTSANDAFSQSANTSWTLVKDSINVRFYYNSAICNGAETFLYKITNNNSSPVKLNWTVWGMGSKEEVLINPNEERVGSCTLNAELRFALPPGFTLPATLPVAFTVFKF